MKALVRTYGLGLTGIFVALVAIWILLLIVVPQIRMIERAFTYEDRGGETAMLALQIDRAYVEKLQIEREIRTLDQAAESPASPGPSTPSLLTPSPSAPTAPSPSFSAPSPSTPSPTTPSPTTASRSAPTLSPFAPSPNAAGADATLSPGERTARLAELRQRLSALETKIADLEAQEDTSSGVAGTKEHSSLKNFTTMSGLHLQIVVLTLVYAFIVTICAFVICYPVAYAAATMENKNKLTIVLVGLLIPYAINELLRIFSWVMILDRNGILNSLLDLLGFIDLSAGEGFRFVASNGAVFAVMVYAYILFMVFPIYNTIDTLDKNQIEAARDLGASSWRIHTRVVIPHAKPGIAVGSIMTFMLSAGSIAAPEIVGRGMHPDWFSQLIYRRFFEADSWNQGSAYSLGLLVACIVFILATMKVFKVGIRDIAK